VAGIKNIYFPSLFRPIKQLTSQIHSECWLQHVTIVAVSEQAPRHSIEQTKDTLYFVSLGRLPLAQTIGAGCAA
jgi:hypothetical protein